MDIDHAYPWHMLFHHTQGNQHVIVKNGYKKRYKLHINLNRMGNPVTLTEMGKGEMKGKQDFLVHAPAFNPQNLFDVLEKTVQSIDVPTNIPPEEIQRFFQRYYWRHLLKDEVFVFLRIHIRDTGASVLYVCLPEEASDCEVFIADLNSRLFRKYLPYLDMHMEAGKVVDITVDIEAEIESIRGWRVFDVEHGMEAGANKGIIQAFQEKLTFRLDVEKAQSYFLSRVQQDVIELFERIV